MDKMFVNSKQISVKYFFMFSLELKAIQNCFKAKVSSLRFNLTVMIN